jgi:hypothetical protein
MTGNRQLAAALAALAEQYGGPAKVIDAACGLVKTSPYKARHAVKPIKPARCSGKVVSLPGGDLKTVVPDATWVRARQFADGPAFLVAQHLTGAHGPDEKCLFLLETPTRVDGTYARCDEVVFVRHKITVHERPSDGYLIDDDADTADREHPDWCDLAATDPDHAGRCRRISADAGRAGLGG